MDDLVSKSKVIEHIARQYTAHGEAIPEWLHIGDLPSAQPERKTGRWIRHPEQKNIYGGKCVECSECGEKYVVQYIEYEKFCRNCGARMMEDSE